MPADSNPEEIELDIKVRVKVVEAKIKQFNASFVSVSTLPIIGDRLKEMTCTTKLIQHFSSLKQFMLTVRASSPLTQWKS